MPSLSFIKNLGKLSIAGAYSTDPDSELNAHPCYGQYNLFLNNYPSKIKVYLPFNKVLSSYVHVPLTQFNFPSTLVTTTLYPFMLN